MSYEIVKAITFKKDGIYLRSDSNNVIPKYFYSHRNGYLSNILESQGKQAAEVAIVRAYEEGNFQSPTPNRYTQILDRLQIMPEYAAYDWRNNNHPYGSDEYKAFNARRRSGAFDLLIAASLDAM